MADETNQGPGEGDEHGETAGSSASVPTPGATPVPGGDDPAEAVEASGVPADITPVAASRVASGGGGRFDELMAKRRTTGLTDPEAEELGRLLAEREGQPYSSAQSLKRRGAGGE